MRGGELRVDPGLITVATKSNKGLLAVSFLLMGLPPAIAALRWQILLGTQGVRVR